MLLSEALESGSEGVLWSGEEGDRVVVVSHEGWRVGFRLTARGRRAAEVGFRPPDPIAGLDQLRQLPLGELLQKARRLAAPAVSPSPFRRPTEVHLQSWQKEGRGRGRSDEPYAWLALEYVARWTAGEPSPARAISERVGGLPKVWSNRIRQAWKRGLLVDDDGEPRLTERAHRYVGKPD